MQRIVPLLLHIKLVVQFTSFIAPYDYILMG